MAAMLGEQAQVDEFDRIYNSERPHQRLPGHLTRQQAWDATPAAEPPRPRVAAFPSSSPVAATVALMPEDTRRVTARRRDRGQRREVLDRKPPRQTLVAIVSHKAMIASPPTASSPVSSSSSTPGPNPAFATPATDTCAAPKDGDMIDDGKDAFERAVLDDRPPSGQGARIEASGSRRSARLVRDPRPAVRQIGNRHSLPLTHDRLCRVRRLDDVLRLGVVGVAIVYQPIGPPALTSSSGEPVARWPRLIARADGFWIEEHSSDLASRSFRWPRGVSPRYRMSAASAVQPPLLESPSRREDEDDDE